MISLIVSLKSAGKSQIDGLQMSAVEIVAPPGAKTGSTRYMERERPTGLL
jgi:hypothetical protein